MWTVRLISKAERKMCKELKQQDGLVQSRSFYFVKKACQVSATNLSKCLMQIDSFYFVPVQPCFHLTLSLYGSFLSYKDGNIFFAFLNFLRIQKYQKSLFSNRRHFSTMLNSVKSELCAGIYCKSERQVTVYKPVLCQFFS